MKASIGIIGLAVMGENLALNMESKGYTVAVFDIRPERPDEFAGSKGAGKRFIPAHSLSELAASLERPRKILMMIKAGEPVDQVIQSLLPILDEGDVIIDGGNSNFADTERRIKQVEAKGILYIGMGVSGGEEGALNGPSLMPGGSAAAWPLVQPLLQTIAAHIDTSPCCNLIGTGGAGHFVKMVHNGIESGDMQLICEIYDIMRKVLKMPNEVMSTVFSDWDKGELCSYLIEITANILNYHDTDGSYLIDKIADTAAQKGTGKWAGMTALSESVPLTLITESVYARCLSSQRTQRTETSEVFSGIQTKAPNATNPKEEMGVAETDAVHLADLSRSVESADTSVSGSNNDELLQILHDALYAAKIISYAQGFELIKTADVHHSWGIDLGELALLWRGGCIIRSVFLEKISEAYVRDKNVRNLIADAYFSGVLRRTQLALRQTVTFAALNGIPVPALSAALAWFDGIRCTHLPANLLQAQRDYFGAHTYERTDKARGVFFHTNWTGHGGETSSTSYTV